jgi:group I intron endonuclease
MIIKIKGDTMVHEDKICGIYIIISIISNKVYVGSSKFIEKRLYRHKLNLQKNKHDNKHLQYAWNKYKEKNFKFIVLEECNEENLIITEQKYIDLFNSTDGHFGYNIENADRTRMTNETREKMSKAKKGKKLSLETRKKMSEAGKGRKITEIHRKRISETLTKNHTGTKLKEEDIINIKNMLMNGMTLLEIAKLFNTTKGHISAIKNNRQWKSVKLKNENYPDNTRKLKEEDVIQILQLIKMGIQGVEIARMFNISPSTISDIKYNRKWKHIEREEIWKI